MIIISKAQVKISEQMASDRKMFGPVYHGTTQEYRKEIQQSGFKITVGDSREGNVKNGYAFENYTGSNVVAPVHHLGFGVYFTTSKTIAKKFNGNSLRGLKTYFLNIPRFEIINFGSPQKMANWWIDNGYDPDLAKRGMRERVQATKKMTLNLKKKYDAIWFKGKGLKTLLDGDQIVVFNVQRIYEIDNLKAKAYELGSKIIDHSGRKGTIVDRSVRTKSQLEKIIANSLSRLPQVEDSGRLEAWIDKEQKLLESGKPLDLFSIKWVKGPKEFNLRSTDFDPIT